MFYYGGKVEIISSSVTVQKCYVKDIFMEVLFIGKSLSTIPFII